MADEADVPEPVSRDDAKLQLNLGTSTLDDALIDRLIVDARDHVERVTGLVLTPREITEPVNLTGRVDLASWPIISVAAVRLSGGDVVAEGSWAESLKRRPAQLFPPAAGWGEQPGFDPTSAPPGEVDLVAGYPDPATVPPAAIRAMLMLIAHWYVNRAAAEVGATAATVTVPLAVEALLDTLTLQLL